ncbi:ECF-type sigma factor [Crateriforma spongiae]|uniref:ECF-type sigma factor n=1 Tax=Crateriforma spongiae TaxID=2724528 RepID=UPI0014480C2A|nr:ECF-type sigma factor [Crateriforma spongiae]
MTIQDTHPELFDHAVQMGRRVASLIEFRPEFNGKITKEDLEQEFMLHILEHLDQFDERRGSHEVFVNLLIRNCTAKLVRQANRKKCKPPAGTVVESTGDVVETGDGTHEELFRMLGIEDKDRRTLGETSDVFELHDMSESVEHLIRTLPRGYRAIARKLKTSSQAEVARDLGISNRRVTEAVKVIREHFGKADWLEN